MVWAPRTHRGERNFRCDDPERIEDILEQSGGDILDAVEPQDVQIKAPEPRHDARLLADTAGIFSQCDVPYIMVRVLHGPVARGAPSPKSGLYVRGGLGAP